MHQNTALIERLYRSLNEHDARAMASCYHPDATFRDIAFHLRGRDRVADMWGMICDTDITASFTILEAGEESAVVRSVDEYTFSETGRPVRNVIESRFRFRAGLIVEHVDACDARLWGAMALGGLRGFIAGRVAFIRERSAARLLREYQSRKKRCAHRQ